MRLDHAPAIAASLLSKRAHDRFLGIADRGEDGRWRFSRLSWAPMD